MSNFNSPDFSLGRFGLALLAILLVLSLTTAVVAQTTVAQGSIQGTVTDPSGAVVGGAKITISNKATGQVVTTTTSSAGTYNSGGLIPGDYMLRGSAKGFKTTALPAVVQVAGTGSAPVPWKV